MKGFDITVFPQLTLDDPAGFYQNLMRLGEIFDTYNDELQEVRDLALKYKEVMERHDPFIQKYTQITCPYCGTVCCANRHGVPDFGDLVMYFALNLPIPQYNLIQDEKAPCQFITPKGCSLERLSRPYRCTWYYCDPLLVQIEIDKPSEYRRFIRDVEELASARGETLSKFWNFWQSKGF